MPGPGINVRIPTQFNFEMMNLANNQITERLNQETIKLATGYKATYYSGAPQFTSAAITSNCAELRTTYHLQQAQTTQATMVMRDSIYQQMNACLTQFAGLCTQSINGSLQDFNAFVEGGAGLEKQFVEALNTTDAQGNYLFSGTTLNIRPVDMAQYPPLTTSADLNVPHRNYYQGSLEGPWPTAAAPCFEKALRAFQGVRFAYTDPTASLADRQKIEQLVLEAIKELNNSPCVELGSRAQQNDNDLAWFTILNLQAKDAHGEAAGADVTDSLEASLMDNIQMNIALTVEMQNLKMLNKYCELLLT